MSPRAAAWLSRFVLAVCLAALAGSFPVHVASRNEPEVHRIYVVGDPSAERIDQVRADLLADGPVDFSAAEDPGVGGAIALQA